MSEFDLILVATLASMVFIGVVLKFFAVDVDENGLPIPKRPKLA